ncbi:aldose 1-epimerase [Geodermatophilus dictyosporus]|uniref:Aldose 1-epimerase n=1 Tax=Geodermatophilus dictyosporus TaxID=1523247 RepID=A0A1I5QRP2_9ACTN|nr:aldose 1-epimerase family protein [Geodermatophilus dictyosporus]SFP48925.1 aldose 1-epimerase [Geodermatophilus dictyosporus]
MTSRVPPTGEQVELRAGDVTAVVTEVGGGLRRLRLRDRDLVAGFGADAARPVFRGSVLAPWPNRVGDGRYRWAGREEQLPLTEPDRRTALHGLLCWTRWEVRDRSSDGVALGARVVPQPGYPHQLDVVVTYRVHGDGLSWRLAAENTGTTAAPYGCSVHPYLVAGPGRVDDWTLSLSAGEYLEVDDGRLLPVGRRPVDGTALDFRAGRTPLRGVTVDHAVTGVAPDPDGTARAEVRCADGSGVALEWDPERLPWVQLHTADRPEPELHRAGLAVEPMTCPPDAFRSGEDVVVLRPGDRHTAEWRIRALTGDGV